MTRAPTMPVETLLVALAMASWSAAIAVKASRAIIVGSEYRFCQWDGGLIRRGRTLTRTGMWIKLMVGSVLAFGIATILGGAVPARPGAWILAGVAGIGLVSDVFNVHPLE